ncbi:oxidoreductase ion channel [Liquorilactobacillus sucicola DSM 21376 = JCM 15457]|uniref:Aryl-alcohol dehydrogenase related enzyme n=1 Tax=Liquorilactobacillus sucicola DSM 21376 = JCM 15457 TaxID=1423806 RepID=A0A023CY91_9LACO|nr:aldo/keto reductase [Liquorilactobacillus sucicola]KRN07607.1 Aryl-alcohol dehydrogenase related enzyme [Liquorilactobacillus sucicola DSM 21376 = JCM 15457]GAJ26759.1 oxidoreductase ion channel [Liquorilactobacillus sucicola DSM 21376 = JCM 15457]
MAENIRVGKSDVITSKLGLGTNKVGGHNLFEGLRDEDGYAVVKAALDEKVSLLDTAYMYGLGRSEEIIGDVLQNYERSQVVLATKAAQDKTNNLKINNSPEFLKQAVDEALLRLKTDYIDIFYIHFPDDETPKDEAVGALAELKKTGKIKAIGVSNFSLAQIKEANKNGEVDIVEDNYNLVHRDAERQLFPYLKANNITFVPYFPLAAGLLTGKYSLDDHKKFKNFSAEQYKNIIESLEKVRQIAAKYNATVAQIFLAWYIAAPSIGIVIPGARKQEQVLSNIKATDVDLSEDDFATIDKLFAAF